jgi:hypothetical protein
MRPDSYGLDLRADFVVAAHLAASVEDVGIILIRALGDELRVLLEICRRHREGLREPGVYYTRTGLAEGLPAYHRRKVPWFGKLQDVLAFESFAAPEFLNHSAEECSKRLVRNGDAELGNVPGLHTQQLIKASYPQGHRECGVSSRGHGAIYSPSPCADRSPSGYQHPPYFHDGRHLLDGVWNAVGAVVAFFHRAHARAATEMILSELPGSTIESNRADHNSNARNFSCL